MSSTGRGSSPGSRAGAARERRELGTVDRTCGTCGRVGLSVMRSRAVRGGLGRVNPFFQAHRKTYALCPDCRSRYPVPEAAVLARSERRGLAVIFGWIAVLLLALVVVAETAVLAALALPVSVPVSIGVLAAVVVVVGALVRHARRGSAAG